MPRFSHRTRAKGHNISLSRRNVEASVLSLSERILPPTLGSVNQSVNKQQVE